MAPLQIEILLWYHYGTRDYRDGDFSAPAVREAIDAFRGPLELLAPETNSSLVRAYRLTDRADAYLKAITELPLPTKKWVVEPLPQAGG